MKSPIFQAPTCIVPSTDLVFPRLQPCQFEAPTSRAPTLSLVQAPTWFLEDSNPLGIQPYLPRHQPCLYEALTSWAPTLSFTSSKYVWLFFTAPNVFFNELWQSSSIPSLSLHVTSSMRTLIASKGVTTALHITQARSLRSPHDDISDASWSPRMPPKIFNMLLHNVLQCSSCISCQPLFSIGRLASLTKGDCVKFWGYYRRDANQF